MTEQVPEWIYVEFSDWAVIYHHGGLVGVGATSYAAAQRGWYLDEVANGTRPAFTGMGRGAVHISIEGENDDWPEAWWPFTDSGAPEHIDAGVIAALQASATDSGI